MLIAKLFHELVTTDGHGVRSMVHCVIVPVDLVDHVTISLEMSA
jgi:hypothetical protein